MNVMDYLFKIRKVSVWTILNYKSAIALYEKVQVVLRDFGEWLDSNGPFTKLSKGSVLLSQSTLSMTYLPGPRNLLLGASKH